MTDLLFSKIAVADRALVGSESDLLAVLLMTSLPSTQVQLNQCCEHEQRRERGKGLIESLIS